MSEQLSDFLVSEITRRYGVVRRARGCFLYTSSNVRLTDLWQQGGRAILGWGAGGAVTVFKNVLERKLTGTFDTDFSPRVDGGSSRISRAVSELLGGERRVFPLLVGGGTAGEAARRIGAEIGAECILYRPWLDCGDVAAAPAVVVEPPFPFGDDVFLLAVRADSGLAPASPWRIPAPLCAAITRAVHDLVREIPLRTEKDWFAYDGVLSRYFVRRGPYLFPKVPEGRWREFVRHCLDCAVVVPPSAAVPGIVPFGADAGNFSRLRKSPFEFGGGE